MKQSRLMSLVEAIVNVLVGYCIAVFTNSGLQQQFRCPHVSFALDRHR